MHERVKNRAARMTGRRESSCARSGAELHATLLLMLGGLPLHLHCGHCHCDESVPMLAIKLESWAAVHGRLRGFNIAITIPARMTRYTRGSHRQ